MTPLILSNLLLSKLMLPTRSRLLECGGRADVLRSEACCLVTLSHFAMVSYLFGRETRINPEESNASQLFDIAPAGVPFLHFACYLFCSSTHGVCTTCYSWPELHCPRRPRGSRRRHHHLRGQCLFRSADGMGFHHVYAGESDGFWYLQIAEAASEVSL